MSNVIPFPVRNAMKLWPTRKHARPMIVDVVATRIRGATHLTPLKRLTGPQARLALAPPPEFIIYL